MCAMVLEAACVLERDPTGWYWQWLVYDCPYCHGQHRHGAGRVDKDDPRRRLDVRVAHCRQDPNWAYQLVALRPEG